MVPRIVLFCAVGREGKTPESNKRKTNCLEKKQAILGAHFRRIVSRHPFVKIKKISIHKNPVIFFCGQKRSIREDHQPRIEHDREEDVAPSYNRERQNDGPIDSGDLPS